MAKQEGLLAQQTLAPPTLPPVPPRPTTDRSGEEAQCGCTRETYCFRHRPEATYPYYAFVLRDIDRAWYIHMMGN